MDYISGWCRSKRRLDGHTAIVTGCNSGIGKEVAADLYARGARVIMACRDKGRAEQAKCKIENQMKPHSNMGSLVIKKLDLSSFRSVREFVGRVLAAEPKIHILVNNAGVMCCPESKTEDGFETHIGTNHFGHALLTLLLLPRLKKSAPSRVVFVSSVLHQDTHLELDNLNFEKSPYNAYLAYCNTKATNILFAKGLALKLKENNINNVTSYSVHPGIIRTEIGRHFGDTIGSWATWIFRYIMGPFLKSVRCGAQTTIYCAVDEACAEQSGQYYSDCAVKLPNKQCQNQDFAIKFWEHTIQALNLIDYDAMGDSDPPKQLLDL